MRIGGVGLAFHDRRGEELRWGGFAEGVVKMCEEGVSEGDKGREAEPENFSLNSENGESQMRGLGKT